MYAVEVGEAVFDLSGPLSSLPLVTFRAKSDTFSPRFRCGTLAVRQFTRALSLRRSSGSLPDIVGRELPTNYEITETPIPGN